MSRGAWGWGGGYEKGEGKGQRIFGNQMKNVEWQYFCTHTFETGPLCKHVKIVALDPLHPQNEGPTPWRYADRRARAYCPHDAALLSTGNCLKCRERKLGY